MTDIGLTLEAGLAGLMVILLGMIKIPVLEINLWGWLGRVVGRAINGEIIKKVDSLAEDLDDFKKTEELEHMRRARQRILRFSDEILEEIDVYEKYCHEHIEYENNRADLAIATIREVYKKCLRDHDFLMHEEKEKKDKGV